MGLMGQLFHATNLKEARRLHRAAEVISWNIRGYRLRVFLLPKFVKPTYIAPKLWDVTRTHVLAAGCVLVNFLVVPAPTPPSPPAPRT